MADTSNKKNIREESLRDLSDFLTAQGEKAFRAKQIWQWIWQRGVTDFAEMSNLSKATRELLSRHYFFDSLFPQQVQTASDGTEKTAWRLTDGEIVESVLFPEIKNSRSVYLHKWVVSWGANSVQPVPWVLNVI